MRTVTVPASEVRPGDRVLIMGRYETITHYQGRQRTQIMDDGQEIFGHAYGFVPQDDNPYCDSVCLAEDFPVTVQRG